MKKKFSSIWRVTLALVLIFSLGAVFAAPTPSAMADGGLCDAVAPDFTICTDTTVDDALFLDRGAECVSCDTCDITIDHSGVDSSTPGTYSYTVTCQSDACVDVATGWVTVKGCVEVNILECPGIGCPGCDPVEPPRTVVPSTDFGVKAEIINNTGEVQFVDAMIAIPANAHPKTPWTVPLGWMDPGERNTAAWTVHCDTAGKSEITVKTNYTERGLPETWDKCIVTQESVPGLAVDLICPCEVCTNCDPGTFNVTAKVQNTGMDPIENVRAILSLTSGTASITYPADVLVGGIEGQGKKYPTWEVTCTGPGAVVLHVDVTGNDACTHGPLTLQFDDCTFEQEEVIVDVKCVRGLQSTLNPDYPSVKFAPKYLPSCTGECLERDVTAAPSGAVVKEKYGEVSTLQMFEVTVGVMNCTQLPKTLAVTITPPMTDAVLADQPVHIVCPKTGTESWVEPNGHGKVTIEGLCGCCEALVTWILTCDGVSASCPTDCEAITVEVVESGESPWSNTPCNPACVIQEHKVHLATSMLAIVDDCDPCEPEWVNTVAVSQDFDVEICIDNYDDSSNTVPRGCYADAYDVTVDVTITGPTTCEGSYPGLDFGDGNIKGGENKCIMLSDLIGSECHCTGEGMTTVSVVVNGFDENTCEEILDGNIESVCPLQINQCDFEVEILNPEWCEDFCWTDRFAVKAEIRNCGTCDFERVSALLTWEGPGDVELVDMRGNEQLRRIGVIDHDPCPQDCTIYEVTWMVHCIKPGDVTFHVCVEAAGNEPMPPEAVANKLQVREINDPAVTVHQWMPPDIAVEIISPENLDTFVATGQEFTVTAAIANKTDWRPMRPNPDGMLEYPVTITDLGLCLHPASGAEILVPPDVTLPFEILAGESATLTWTLQCDESGLQALDAWAVAKTDDSCHELEAYSFPILMWQYPTAHLEVDITEVIPGTTIPACTEFEVHYTVTNTGEADATEVEAVLSVIPEGTARPAEGIDQGYTVDIGTLEAHGQDGVYEGVWRMHCKEACESTINITAEGFDEYGWHKKQVCQSTGNFIIEDGCSIFIPIGMGGDTTDPSPTGAMAAVFVGEASGLLGPFNLNVPVSFNGEDLGNMVAMGAVLPDMDYVQFNNHVASLLDICPDCPALLDLLEWFNLQGVDKDVMIFVGQLVMDSSMDEVPSGCFCASAGLLQVINGHFSGAGVSLMPVEGLDVMAFLDGEYCSVMAQDALRPIDAKFIEDANVTVKQLEVEADLDITKVAVPDTQTVGKDVTFTITVENLGPSDATGVRVTDLLPSGVNYVSSSPDQGWYDVTSGTWNVGDLVAGVSVELDITVTVNVVGKINNVAHTSHSDQPDPTTSNNADMAVVTGEAAPPVMGVTVSQGWNLVSLPIIPGTTAPHDIPIDVMTATLGTELDMIYGHDPEGETPLDFPWYDPVLPLAGSPLQVMVDGFGYWVKMLDGGVGGSFTFDGWELVAETDPPSLPPSYAVVEGWNLIGFKSTTPKLAADYLDGIAGKYVMIYGYEDDSFFIAGSLGHEMLQPGLGYWIALKDGEFGTIFP